MNTIAASGVAVNLPAVSSSDNSSPISSRLVNLQTGEIEEFASYLEAFEAAATRSADGASGAVLASGAPGSGLVQSAISHRAPKSVFKLSVHADIVTVKAERGGADEYDDPDGYSPSAHDIAWSGSSARAGGDPAKRDKVRGYSIRSRSRLLRSLAMAVNVGGGYFLTLTFPDLVVSAFAEPGEMGRWAKTCLDVLLKRMRRQFPDVRGWWRLEFQSRKSGQFVGQDVPHFHLLVFGIPDEIRVDVVRRWLRMAWFSVVGTNDEKHKKAGTQCDVMTSRKHASAYASKYAAKGSEDCYEAGRRWGEFGEIDKSASLVVDISGDEWAVLRRLFRSWLKARKSRYAGRLASLPASVGASVFGLGDSSLEFRAEFGATILRMLAAAGIDRHLMDF